MCTLHARCNVKFCVRSTIAPPPPRFTRQHQKEKMFLASLYFRGGDFLLVWKGHFSFWCSAQKFLGRCRGEENSVTPRFSRSTALTLTAFFILVLFGADFLDFGMVRWGFGRVSSKEETDGIQCRDITLGDFPFKVLW